MRPSVLGARGLDSRSKVLITRIADLSINPRNARIHSPQQVREIARSIKRFGFNNPVLIDRGNQLIAGHGRVEAAKLLGYKAVPALRLDHMTDEEKRAYVIADNKLAEKAGWATEILAIEFQGLIDLGFGIGSAPDRRTGRCRTTANALNSQTSIEEANHEAIGVRRKLCRADSQASALGDYS